MALTYEPIATTTLSVDTTEVTFSSIPGTYTDLIIVTRASMNAPGAGSLLLRFNSDTGTNYSTIRMYGSGSSTGSDGDTSQTAMGAGIIGIQADSSAGVFITHIMNYSNTTTYKSILSRGSDDGSAYVSAYTALWRSTSAITNIKLRCGSIATPRDFRSGGNFTLYGIKAA